MLIIFTVVALGPVTCLTNGTGSQLTTVNKKRIIAGLKLNVRNCGDMVNVFMQNKIKKGLLTIIIIV